MRSLMFERGHSIELLARADTVADASEEISDWIGHRHRKFLTSST